MIRISSLYTLEDVSDNYYIMDNLIVVNMETNTVLSPCLNKGGYPYVTLQRKDASRTGKKVPMHKIVALAFINNAPFEVIEHLDNDKTNYEISNLKFSDRVTNMRHAMEADLLANKEEIFHLVLKDGREFYNTMRSLVDLTGIAQGTLYDNLYFKRNSRKIAFIEATGNFVYPCK